MVPVILLWYGSFSHVRHILLPHSSLRAHRLHKARYGPTALTLWYHHITTFPLCYNGTLVWLSLTNTPHACHFSVVYNVHIAGVFAYPSVCFSHFRLNKLCPLIHCTLSAYCISQRLVHKVNPVVYRIQFYMLSSSTRPFVCRR